MGPSILHEGITTDPNIDAGMGQSKLAGLSVAYTRWWEDGEWNALNVLGKPSNYCGYIA